MPNLLNRTIRTPILHIAIVVISLVSVFSYFYLKHNTVVISVDPMVNTKADIVAVISEYVRDEQGVLGPFVQTLDRAAKDWRNTLGIEVQVVIIHQAGSDINELSNDIFRTMNIGNGYETGGLLIVINSASNEARIEVTGSLEGVFTDAMIGLLAHNQLAP